MGDKEPDRKSRVTSVEDWGFCLDRLSRIAPESGQGGDQHGGPEVMGLVEKRDQRSLTKAWPERGCLKSPWPSLFAMALFFFFF